MGEAALVGTPTKRTNPADNKLDALFGAGPGKVEAEPTPAAELPPPPDPPKKSSPAVTAMAATKYAKLKEEWPYQRFTQQDWMHWGSWLTDRLFQRFPDVPAASWLGRLVPYMNDNNSFFVRNDTSVLLANAFPRVPDGKEVILEAFAVCRFAVPREGTMAIPHGEYDQEKHLVSLYQHLKEWGKQRRAHRLFIGQGSDIWAQRLREVMDAKHCRWVGFAL